MKIEVDSTSYNLALDTITSLIGTEADCILTIADSKARLETSSDVAWMQLPLELLSCDGEGTIFSKIEFLKVVRPKVKSMTLTYDGSDHIEVEMGRARGAIRVLREDDVEVERPASSIKVSTLMPAKLLKFATGAVVFKPLLESSSPNAILEVESGGIGLSSYDTYVGTSYKARNSEVKAKKDFQVVIELDYWRLLVGKLDVEAVVKMGANDRDFRVKTEKFDLYHALVQADRVQNVREVIDKFLAQEALATIEFDGREVTEAIDSVRGIIQQGDKDESGYTIRLKNDVAILAAESSAGEMEAEFDVSGLDSDAEVEFKTSSSTFADTLKLTRDEGLKYGPVRLTVLPDHLVMQSLKVPAASIAPRLQS